MTEIKEMNVTPFENMPKRVLGICAQSVIFYYR